MVGGLHYAPRAMLPMLSVDALEVEQGKGVVGDRYYKGTGHLVEIVEQLGIKDDRHLTLFEQETVDALARDHGITLGKGVHRRNVTTIGVALEHLIGRRFQIGDVVLEGRKSAQPCKHLEDVIGQPVTHLLINRGGLHCRLLSSGTIRVGDMIKPL
ncbi:MOSC domain-containing protein [Achromobacter sp. HZ28]|nr:MOSC domain-containing protein [Achromobacter sp. HZ34]OWT68048.1 MOSC domain-containing protein [Achromobacter sp. HZ28]